MNEAISPELRRQIEWDCTRLINLHATLNDAARWDDLAALYTVDAKMARPTAPDQPITGRDAILASFKARPPRVTRHVCANIVIDVETPERAVGHSSVVLYTGSGAPLVGTSSDVFALTPDGWKFAERNGSVTFGP